MLTNITEEKASPFKFDQIKDIFGQTIHNPQLLNDLIHKTPTTKLESEYISTGFNLLDEKSGGFRAGELSIIAARPGMGKTAFMISMLKNIAIVGNSRVAIFSFERDGIQITNRILEQNIGLPIQKIKELIHSNELSKELTSQLSSVVNAQIIIDDENALTIQHLISRIQYLVENQKADIIFIDAVELILNQRNPEDTGRDIKAISERFNIPIVLFSSISRLNEMRKDDKRPVLEDLHAGIHAYADTVMFIYRPDYYFVNSVEEANRNKAEIIIGKNKSHELASVWLKYDENKSAFVDM